MPAVPTMVKGVQMAVKFRLYYAAAKFTDDRFGTLPEWNKEAIKIR